MKFRKIAWLVLLAIVVGATAYDAGEADENWYLVSFIRYLPRITPEKLDEMKGLNPKTEADRAEEQEEQEFLKGGEPSRNPGATHHR